MSIFSNLISKFNKKSIEQRNFFPETTGVYGALLFRGENNPTVSACINKIASTLSILPLQLYSHTKKGKKLAVGFPLFHLLEKPAAEETSTLWYGTLIRHILYKGNGYIYLGRNSKGEIVNLSIVDPSKVNVQRDSSFHKLFIIDGKVYNERNILHIPYNGPGYNGTIGISPIDINKDLITLDNDLLNYIRVYFNNSLGSRYALELGEAYSSKPSDLASIYAAVTPIINKYVAGSDNAGKLMVPPPNSKLTKIEQSSNVQAQLASLVEMVEKQIALSFNVPYEMISGDNKYNSLETKQNEFLSNCILPLGNHICESFEKLIPIGNENLFISYDYKDMLTTDTKSTIDYLRQEVQSGLLSINEARSKLGMESIDDEAGNNYFIPSNLMPLTDEIVQAYMAKQKLALQEMNNNNHLPQGDNLA